MNKNHVIVIILALATLDAVYLVASQLDSNILYCSTTGVINCSAVLDSAYSHIFGVPMSVFGLIWALVAFYVFVKARGKDLQFIWALAGAGGILYSLAAMTLLQEICEYCLALDIMIFLALIAFYRKPKSVAQS